MTSLYSYARLFWLAMALWILASATPALAQQLSSEEQDYLARRAAVVFVSQANYPPFKFIDNEGNRAGMCVELARWIATTLGFQARFSDASFHRSQEAVLEGRADVITSLFSQPPSAPKCSLSAAKPLRCPPPSSWRPSATTSTTLI